SNSDLYALNFEGVFRLNSTEQGTEFESLPQLNHVYRHLLPYEDGILLSRFGGVDFFDGNGVRFTFLVKTRNIHSVTASRRYPGSLYLVDNHTLSVAVKQVDGSFLHTPICNLSDACTSLHEDDLGRLWIG